MRIVFFLIIASCALANLVQAKCTPETCALVDCFPMTKEACLAKVPGYYEFEPKGGFCGCCDACVKVLGQGEACSRTHPEEVRAHDYCGNGLICNPETLRCYRPFGPLGK